MFVLRAARPDEGAALSELCLRSKAVWGYDAAFMQACQNELTVTTAAIENGLICVADQDGLIVGMAEIISDGKVADLAKLFVEPDMLRNGIGRKLFDWATAAAGSAGADSLTIEADPGAAEFYRCMGAVDDGSVASGSIAGRYIPRLKLVLNDSIRAEASHRSS